MHWEIRSLVHIVTKGSNDPELSRTIPSSSILRNYSEIRYQARSAGAIFYAKCSKCPSAGRQQAMSAYIRRKPADPRMTPDMLAESMKSHSFEYCHSANDCSTEQPLWLEEKLVWSPKEDIKVMPIVTNAPTFESPHDNL